MVCYDEFFFRRCVRLHLENVAKIVRLKMNSTTDCVRDAQTDLEFSSDISLRLGERRVKIALRWIDSSDADRNSRWRVDPRNRRQPQFDADAEAQQSR